MSSWLCLKEFIKYSCESLSQDSLELTSFTFPISLSVLCPLSPSRSSSLSNQSDYFSSSCLSLPSPLLNCEVLTQSECVEPVFSLNYWASMEFSLMTPLWDYLTFKKKVDICLGSQIHDMTFMSIVKWGGRKSECQVREEEFHADMGLLVSLMGNWLRAKQWARS